MIYIDREHISLIEILFENEEAEIYKSRLDSQRPTKTPCIVFEMRTGYLKTLYFETEEALILYRNMYVYSASHRYIPLNPIIEKRQFSTRDTSAN